MSSVVKKMRAIASMGLSVVLALGLCPMAYADPIQGGDSQDSAVSVDEGVAGEATQLPEASGSPSSSDANTSRSEEENRGGDELGSTQDAAGEAAKDSTDDETGAPGVSAEPASPVAPQAEAEPKQSANDQQGADQKVQDLPDGDYLVMSALQGSRVLDVKNGSRSNSATIQTYSYNNTGAQKWRISHDKDGYLIIKNIGSGKVLDVRGGSTKNGTLVQQYSSNGSKAQRWVAIKNSDGTFTIASALNQKKVLDIKGASTALGAKVQLYQSNGSKAQKFTFKTLNPKVAPCEKLIDNGYYEVASNLNGNYVFDIAGGSLANGGNLQLYKKNGSLAQIFKFTYSNGYYLIQAASGRALDVVGGGILNGTNVQQYASNKSNAQLWSAQKNKDGSYTFTSKVNGLVMDVRGGKAANGSNVQCYSSNGSKAQQFVLKKKTNLLSSGTYTLRPAISSSRVLDVKSASTANGANVQLYSSNGSQCQKWAIALVPDATNTYTLRSIGSGKYLAMDSNGNVCQRNRSTDGSQFWTVSLSAGKVAFTNVKYNKVLEVAGGSNKDGANVRGYKWNSTNAQRFVVAATSLLDNGTYAVKSAADKSQVLDVASGSYNNGANVQTYKSNGTGAQKWKITRNSDGTYRVANAQSGKVLDVYGGAAKSGQNVHQYTWNASKAQKWRLIDNGDGTFKLESALKKGLVLEVSGSPRSSANVRIATDTGAANQRFVFGATSYTPYSGQQLAMLNKAKGYSSRTNYLILVDCKANKVAIFRGSKGNWSYVKYWSCTTGAPSSPTKKGVFKIGSRGNSFGSGYTCWYWTQFSGNYLFHSVLYSPGSKVTLQDGRLGMNLSHGCVRLNINNAKWINSNIPSGTTVVTY